MVELLVVIGIIAVLIGILVPVLSKARREADRAHCLSNMRSMQIAQWNYAVDNRGYMIRAGMAHGGAHAQEGLTWFNTLGKYYGSRLSPRCKADTSVHWETPVVVTGEGPQLRRCSYGINAFLDGELGAWGKGFEQRPPDGGFRGYWKVTQVRKPAEVVQFAEMAYAGSYAASDHVHADQWATPKTPMDAIPINAGMMLQIHAHGGKVGWEARANYGFLDGHAESLTFREVYRSLFVNRFDPGSPQQMPGN